MSVFFDLDMESMVQEGFYAPKFEVKIAGVGLPKDVLRDVVSLTYRDSVEKLDGFEIRVNNWDVDRNTFKYVGSETTESLAKNPLHRLFDPCNKAVTIVMGYQPDSRVMLTGNFTTVEPTFTSGGAPMLNVRGLNVLHQLRRKKTSKTWQKKTVSEIVKSLERNLPVPVETDPEAKRYEEPIDFVSMRNAYPVDFILTKARERGYVVFLQEEDPKVKGSKRRLYFGRSQAGIVGWTDFSFELDWGTSLIEFKPTLTTANQVRAVTVRGWHRPSRSPITETVDLNDKRLNRNQDLHELVNACDPRETIVVDEPVFTKRQARNRAIAILKDKQKQMVQAEGETVGLPDLRSGKKVKIGKVGSRFNGIYFVTETTYTIDDRGYRTRFKARRENPSTGGGA